MSQILFPDSVPAYCAAGPSLQCPAQIDGAAATFEITAEALEDHFGARSYLYEDLASAFSSHRKAIENVARSMFEMTGAHSIVLHSGHFRFSA
ncbi:DUF1488 domain-containing protein [Cupriavidus pinatubonensis]|uniref:DUF1488 domain-containing protein n=1 Tax=Cupriavidus pinatubonensis (strain JMP 134 / LMG 1197) TaxID=264198 RepID=Q472V1_CUPPJ|nr:DUF1488 domain-containing protein [Cupriavidus pinatubonensis]QYY32705.1 DUF1488 domain-containing protein [Cupriavidus pinatubonensis]QYY32785.1 DUF1488 domain-containing protein [Cupriavidus pinatubonensis]TPQ43391.1 DUF1488 domain-containing protein [Cupriavidus pinatubonensis]